MKMEGDIFKYVIYMKFFSRGFTLVELMVVIAIIWILTTALYPFHTGYLNRARDFAIKTAMIRLRKNASDYKIDAWLYEPVSTSDCINLTTTKYGLIDGTNFWYWWCAWIYAIQYLSGQINLLRTIWSNSNRWSLDSTDIFRATKWFSRWDQHLAIFMELSDWSIWCVDDTWYNQKSGVATSTANFLSIWPYGLCK